MFYHMTHIDNGRFVIHHHSHRQPHDDEEVMPSVPETKKDK